MKKKRNRGYVAIDASIAILSLLIIIPTIAGMVYNVNKTNNLIDRKTEAISIAINTIEAVKGIGIDGLNDLNFNESVVTNELDDLYNITNDDTPKSEIDENNIKSITGITLLKDENTYKIQVDIQDYADTIQGKAKTAREKIVKTIKVIVTYKSGKQEKQIELSTVIA